MESEPLPELRSYRAPAIQATSGTVTSAAASLPLYSLDSPLFIRQQSPSRAHQYLGISTLARRNAKNYALIQTRSTRYMKHPASPLRFLPLLILFLILAPLVNAQSDLPRQTVAITYPLDQSVEVKFRGTTLLPRLKGEAKVRRAGRRGTRVELSVEDL